jgi:hypothetical protein
MLILTRDLFCNIAMVCILLASPFLIRWGALIFVYWSPFAKEETQKYCERLGSRFGVMSYMLLITLAILAASYVVLTTFGVTQLRLSIATA